MKKFFKHLHLVNKHRFKVLVYCCRCGQFWRGLLHDLSKYSPVEFFESVKYYNGKCSPIEKCKMINGFSKAWIHHKNHNKHHIEYWIDLENEQQMIIPYKYVVETVCDKISATKCYLGKEYSTDKVLGHWIKTGQNVPMHTKIKLFFTTVFTDLTQNGEKEVLNKKYLRSTYDKIIHMQ